ncbi:hemocyte protein-glutamine gamma-glutamyltransferase-like isoform X2 [Rhopilema esculentum]|uniref:hemocyte protein-glutamine gamma-glutamyltransferase-like isoform X2 n=1 Tax=Rhopilema esculentum TaxID=499914 RepID=UPI0031DBE05C|eukprot:gene7750-13589_t
MTDKEEVPQGMPVEKIKGLSEVNEVVHHTEKYESAGLFLRRGQTFKIEIDLKRAYKEDEDQFNIKLETGKYPKKRNGSLISIQKVEEFEKSEWGYRLLKCCGTTLEVEINIPADCIVAKYSLAVESVYKQKAKKRSVFYYLEGPVYILYNAWCPEDEVYMKDEKQREEYVLNDNGAVFWGGRRPKPWYFGQFTNASFTCVMNLLDRVSINYRDTAREVARAISALANDSDDQGVLTGNWSGDYDTGVKPWEWTGSVAIFKKYLETGSPVHYGQCWVFSGITTSLMRSLGIPTRSITNYDSAHDTDNNLTFDKYFSADGDYLDEESDDSCWNFHVWNESYMSRPDLPPGYGGWQAFDATPQELSKGKYRAGPASVRAIKEGKVNLKYDTKFIFAEVNSDKVYWRYNKEKENYEPFRVDTDAVGHDISTASFGWSSLFSKAHDVTSEYKYPEGSKLERIAVRRAMKIARSDALVKAPSDVRFSIEAPENVVRGENVVANLQMKNTSSEKLSVDVSLTSQIVRYTGVALMKLKRRKNTIELEAGKEETTKFSFTPAEYSGYMDENPMLRFTVMAIVSSGQTYAKQAVVTIEKPHLDVTLVGRTNNKVKSGEKISVKVGLTFPSDVKKLTNCKLIFDGTALEDEVSFDIPDTEDDKLIVEKSLEMKKITKGRVNLQIIAMLSAKEMTGLEGILALDLDK